MYTSVAATLSSTIALLITGMVTRPASAATIFFEDMTGAQLAASDNVSFPTNAPALMGTSLHFWNGADDQVLMQWDLLPSGPRGPLRFTVDVNYSPGGDFDDDNDPIFAITDGTSFAGIFRTDNDNSSASTLEGTVTGSAVALGPGESIATGLGSVQPFTFELSTGPTTIAKYAEGTFASTATFQIPGGQLDPSRTLSLILASGSVSHGEKYRLHSLRVSVEAVPEPSTAGMLLSALGLWIGVRGVKRRRRPCVGANTVTAAAA